MKKNNNLEKKCPWFLSTIFIAFVYLITFLLLGIPGIILQIIKIIKVKPIKKRSIIGLSVMCIFSIILLVGVLSSINEDKKIQSLIDEGKYIEAQQILNSKLTADDWSDYSLCAELYEKQGDNTAAAKKVLEFCLLQKDKSNISDDVIVKLRFYGDKSSKEVKNQVNDFMDKRDIAIATNGKEQNGHNWKEATCDKPKTCSVCGLTEGKALGHNWKEATCEQPKTCSVCGGIEGNSLGHKFGEFIIKKKPSCSEFGIKEGKCTVCKKHVTENIAKLKHKYGKYIIVEKPTCEKKGKEEATCSLCGDKKFKVIGKKKHKSNGWEIISEATFNSSGTKSRFCKFCGKELETKSYSLSSKDKEYYYKDHCNWYNYNEIARYPDNYVDKYAAFSGEVLQVIESDNEIQLRIYVEDDSNKCIFVKYKRKKGESRILEGDYVNIYGKMKGLVTYETIAGAKVTIPSMNAEYIVIY